MTDQAAASQRTARTQTSRIPPSRPDRLWRDLLGQQLRELRRARRETLDAVARRANLSTQYLSEVERGVKEPSSEVVAAIGAALGTTLLDLTESVADQLRADRGTAPARRGDVALAA